MSYKYKVGEKVKIKSWIQMEKEFGLDKQGDIKTPHYCSFLTEMEREMASYFPGRIIMIEECVRDAPGMYLTDFHPWSISDEMIEYSLEEYDSKKRGEYKNRVVLTRFDLLDFED